jgi:hypothetical protein
VFSLWTFILLTSLFNIGRIIWGFEKSIRNDYKQKQKCAPFLGRADTFVFLFLYGIPYVKVVVQKGWLSLFEQLQTAMSVAATGLLAFYEWGSYRGA